MITIRGTAEYVGTTEPASGITIIATTPDGTHGVHGRTDHSGQFEILVEGPRSAPEVARIVLSAHDKNSELIWENEYALGADDLAALKLRVPAATTKGSNRPHGRAHLRLSPENPRINVGETVHFTAYATGGRGGPIRSGRPSWNAIDTRGRPEPISEGLFTAERAGTYEIQATSGTLTGKTVVVVSGAEVEDPSLELRRDDLWSESVVAAAFEPRNRIGGTALAAYPQHGRTSLFSRTQPLVEEAANIGSANFSIRAPIVTISGRGPDVRLELTYNSRVWTISSPNIYFDFDDGWPSPGWTFGFGKVVRAANLASILISPDGTRHAFKTDHLSVDSLSYAFQGHTIDATYIDYTHIDSLADGGGRYASARYADGTVVTYTSPDRDDVRTLYPTRIQDVHGNHVRITYRNNRGPRIETIVDTAGRAINFHYDELERLVAVTAPGLDSTTRTVCRMNYTSLRVGGTFNGLTVQGAPQEPISVLRAIYYPGTHTATTYEYSPYGMITRVADYALASFSGGSLTEHGLISTVLWPSYERVYNYPSALGTALNDVPTYTEKTESWSESDTPPAITKYRVEEHAAERRVTTVYPNGLIAVSFLHKDEGKARDGMLFRYELYGGGHLLKNVINEWEEGDYQSPQLRITSTSHGQSAAIKTEFDYGKFGRLLETREYGHGRDSSLLRRTRIAYDESSEYLQRHIFRLPSEVRQYEGLEEAPVSRTDYIYDEFSLAIADGIVGHASSHNPLSNDYDPGTHRRGIPTTVRQYVDPSSSPEFIEDVRRYDIAGNLISMTSGPFHQESYIYRLATQFSFPSLHLVGPSDTASDRLSTSAEYDFGTGLPRSFTDPNGRTVETDYYPDSLRPREVRRSTGGKTTFDYDVGAVTDTVVNDYGQWCGRRVVLYNGLGLVRQVRGWAGGPEGTPPEEIEIVDTQYDSMGQVERQSRPYYEGGTPVFTVYLRDVLGRVLEQADPDGSLFRNFYDEQARPDEASPSDGRTIRTVDPWGRETWTRFNSFGQVEEMHLPAPDGAGAVLTAGTGARYYEYNVFGQLRRVGALEVPIAQNTRYRYDGLGRITHIAIPEGTTTLNDEGEYRHPGARWTNVFRYYDRTRLAWSIDARGSKASYRYDDDPLGRLQRVEYSSLTAWNGDAAQPAIIPSPEVSYIYMDHGDVTRLKEMSSGDVTISFDYDSEGRTKASTTVFSDLPDSPFVTTYVNDFWDRLSSLIYPAEYGLSPSGRPGPAVSYGYDNAGRLSYIGHQYANVVNSISYAAGGIQELVSLGPQFIVEKSHINRLTGLIDKREVKRGAKLLLDLEYDYALPGVTGGVVGQVLGVQDRLRPERSVEYSYDARGQLREAIGAIPGETPEWVQTYINDRFGNRTSVECEGAMPDGTSMPADGRKTEVDRRNRIASPGFVYNEAGALVRGVDEAGNSLEYSYDSVGRLVMVSDSDGPVEAFSYGDDRRRLRTKESRVGRERIHVWHNDGIIAEYQVAGGDVRWERSYVREGARVVCTMRRSGATGVLPEYVHSERAFPRLRTSPYSNNVVEQLLLPYGTALTDEDPGDAAGGLAGYSRSQSTGLDYAVNRNYDPTLGRFLEPDPRTFDESGQPVPANSYAYCQSDPTNRHDPDGLRWKETWFGISYWEGSTLVITGYWGQVWYPDDRDQERGGNGLGGDRSLREAAIRGDRARGDNRAYDRLVKPFLASPGPRQTTGLDVLAAGALVLPGLLVGGILAVDALLVGEAALVANLLCTRLYLTAPAAFNSALSLGRALSETPSSSYQRVVPTAASSATQVVAAQVVGSAMKADATHRAATFAITDAVREGMVFKIVGGDKVERTLLQNAGQLNEKLGVFEWLIGPRGLEHQRFKEGLRQLGDAN